MSAAREIGELLRRIESLEAQRRESPPPPSPTVFGLLRQASDRAVSVESVLSGGVPAGVEPYPVIGSAVILTDTSGYFQITTPFRNALAGLWCISADTAVFAGTVGISDRGRRANGVHAPMMRCYIGGTATAQVYVHANWVAYGA